MKTALARRVNGAPNLSYKVDQIIDSIVESEDLAWIVATAYGELRRRTGKLPDGIIFTPPWLAEEVVSRLIPGLTVVDLGAGSGMLTIAAAKKGFRVTAIEEDSELVAILDSLARLLKLRGRIELIMGNALSYSRRSEAQIMSNPPYTRHHSIPLGRKYELAEFAKESDVKLPSSSGYYCYFMAYAWNRSWSKREVLLLPTNWIETNYGEVLRELLMRRTHQISVVENGHRRPIFDHALTTASLVTTQNSKLPPLPLGPGAPIRTLKVPGQTIAENKSTLVPLLERKLSTMGQSSTKPHTIGEIFKVGRGIATGDNDFFVLSEETKRSARIRRSETLRIIRGLKPRFNPKDTGFLWFPSKRDPSEASRRLIRAGEELEVNLRYLCKHRKTWWRVETPDGPPGYFLSYMGRGKPRLVRNRKGLWNLNNILGLYMRQGTSGLLGRKVASWLASSEGTEAMLNQARHYYGGMWKLEPGDVERLEIPARLVP
jgi:hypothetical protein